MTDTPVAELRKTPLHARHRASNARMVPFAGWEMPVEYSGITNEHLAVRTRAGVFDVSHMGEIEIAGTSALAAELGPQRAHESQFLVGRYARVHVYAANRLTQAGVVQGGELGARQHP